MALAVYARSKATYKVLSDIGFLQLLIMRSVQQKLQNYVDKSGICHDYLFNEQQKYAEFKAEKKKCDEAEPVAEGIFIFDEVKIIEKLIWNSKMTVLLG